MPAVLIQQPATEPVGLADATAAMRVIDSSEDAFITMLLIAARQYAEAYTGRSFITQKWALTLDSFPGRMTQGMSQYGTTYSIPPNAILLEHGNVQSVDSIVYTDMSSTVQTILTPGLPQFAIDLSGCPARITPGFGQIFPIPLPQIAAVTINYTAGYGLTGASVPAGIRQWIIMRAATLYENREQVAIVPRGRVEPLPFVDTLLDPYVVHQA